MSPDHLPPPVASAIPGLRLDTLTAAKEKTYFAFAVVISVLVWLGLAVSIIGAFYAVFIGFFLWLGHGLLAAYLRSEAVRVSPQQFPELHAAFLEVCQRLNVTRIPRLYVVQAGGALNAFATRHSGRDFVVVFSDFLEAIGPSSPEMKFILGHELGHLASGHILKHTLLAPALFCPLLGSAYRRSWETSCDRHGTFAAQDAGAALRAMLTLSGGKAHGARLDAEAFASQHENERGFFVSLHELTSTYPTLSRRVRDLRALQTGTVAPRAPRNRFAYLFALITPGGNLGGGGAGALVTVVMIGLLAAMAVPAFQKVRQASIEKVCAYNRFQLNAAYEQHAAEHGKPPESVEELIGQSKTLKAMPVCPSGGEYFLIEGDHGVEISCSVHGHGVPLRPGAPR